MGKGGDVGEFGEEGGVQPRVEGCEGSEGGEV